MSFSSDIKEELSKISNLANKEAVKLELMGYFLTGNISKNKNYINFSTESEYNINRFCKLLNNQNVINYSINIQGKIYTVSCRYEELKNILIELKSNLNKNMDDCVFLQDENLEKAIVRGAFLGGGSINNPEKKYHGEIIFNEIKESLLISNILKKHNINFKTIQKNNKVAIYSKEGETIANFLAFIGANSGVLRFEEIRVVRDMRNNINRVVNCETANLNKTVNAALKQIEDIKIIKSINKFEELPETLKEIANLRLEHPESSLQELGSMLKNPVGKSGVNHRLKKISEIAREEKK